MLGLLRLVCVITDFEYEFHKTSYPLCCDSVECCRYDPYKSIIAVGHYELNTDTQTKIGGIFKKNKKENRCLSPAFFVVMLSSLVALAEPFVHIVFDFSLLFCFLKCRIHFYGPRV